MDPVEQLVGLDEIGRGVDEDVDVDADVVQSDQSEEDVDVLLRNDETEDSDDDGQEQVNLPEINDNPVPFFMNLDGVDDSAASQDLYHCGPIWSDINPEFARGMVFKDKDAVIRACNWYHVKRNKHYYVVETNKKVWSTRCSHDCP